MALKAAVDYPAAPLDDPAVVSIATPYRQFPSVRARCCDTLLLAGI